MTSFKRITYTNRLKWRVRGLWVLLIALVAYMVIVGETGGDSRVLTPQARQTSAMILFGGMAWTIGKIIRTKKLLRYPNLAKRQRLDENDERNRYIHDKSGGIVWDATFIALLFTTMHAGLYSMPAFYTAAAMLGMTVLFKLIAWGYYSQAYSH